MLLSLPKVVFSPPRADTAHEVSHVDDGNSLRLRPTWFFGELGQIIRVAGQQHDRTTHLKSGDGHDSVDGTPMTGKPCCPEQLAGPARDRRRHRDDGDSG